MRGLIAVMHESPTLAFVRELPSDELVLGEERFVAEDVGDFTGFYDWLRAADGAILGVRYRLLENETTPEDDARWCRLRDAVRHLRYVTLDEARRIIEVYFSADRDFVPARSNDQDFGDNRLFFSATGTAAVTFTVDRLETTELESLLPRDPRGL